MTAWEEFLVGTAKRSHAVQLYRDVQELARSVAGFVSTGLAAGAPALLVATAEHEQLFRDELERLGWEVEQLLDDGQLVTRDADRLLESVLRNGYPASAAFDEAVGSLLDDLLERFPGAEPRVFGEMVDILSRRGDADAAISLEELWNSIGWSRSFSLLCGYELDVFDAATQRGRLPEICRTHTHVRAAADPRRLARAVDDALDEVLGPGEAERVYLLVAGAHREEQVPAPARVLMWVSEHLPVDADRILAAARAHYASG